MFAFYFNIELDSHQNEMKIESLKLMIMKKTIFICLLLISSSASAEVINKIIAKVNHEVITEEDLNEFKKLKESATRKTFPKKLLLDELIDTLILEREVERSDINITEEEVTQAISNQVAQEKTTIVKLEKKLQKEGKTLNQYRNEININLKKQRFLQEIIYPKVRILDYDTTDYYQNNPSEFLGYEYVRFYEILLTRQTLPPGKNPLQFASGIRNRLVKGESIRKLAKKYSQGAFASQGGDSKMIQITSLRPEIANIIYQLKKGQVSRPIPTENGIFIIKLLDFKGKTLRNYEDVKNDIRQILFEKRVDDELQEYLLQVRPRHYVEIMI